MENTNIDPEKEVALRLAQRVPRQEESEELGGVNPDPSDPDGLHNNLPLDNISLRYELMDYFNVGVGLRHSSETQEQINTIMQWAVDETGSTNISEVLKQLNLQEAALGTRLKGDRLLRVYRYVRIAQQKRVLDAKMEAMIYA